jgi:hypothetical protein
MLMYVDDVNVGHGLHLGESGHVVSLSPRV